MKSQWNTWTEVEEKGEGRFRCLQNMSHSSLFAEHAGTDVGRFGLGNGADPRAARCPGAAAPCTLRPTLYTLYLTPNTLHPTPYTLHPAPHTLQPTPCAQYPEPSILDRTLNTLR